MLTEISMTFAELMFWLFSCLLVWTFVMYPLTIWMLSLVMPKSWGLAVFTGKVSMIVAAHNEEEVIREKVKNSLNLDFGPADWEVIIVSDGSTDATENILAGFKSSSERLRVITYQPRAGKAHALNVGVSSSSGDMLIFSDANVILEPDTPRKLMLAFCDPGVGAACARVLVRGRGKDEIAGESLYMRFEGLIQRAEAKFWSMVGIDGALFALRRELFRPLKPEIILDDFALSMEAPLAGQRIVYAKEARAIEEVESSAANEFRRKSRIVAGGYQYLFWLFKGKGKMNWRVWFSFFSHKVLRWLAPIFMIGILVCNFVLIGSTLFKYLLTVQLLFYFLGLTGHFVPIVRKNYLFYMPYYFCIINLASLIGLMKFLSRHHDVLWEKVSR